MLNNIINDLRNLEGKEVGKNSYFHKIYTNETEITEISILDVLKSLENYEFENFTIITYEENEEGYEEEIEKEVSAEEYLDYMEYEEINCGNSYNWLAPVSNHFNYNIYKSEMLDNVIVEFKVHRFGDVRGNYTEECYLEFNNEYEFYDALIENSKYFKIIDKDNNIEYFITIDILNDCPTIEKLDIELNEMEYIEGYESVELIDNLLEMENIEIIED